MTSTLVSSPASTGGAGNVFEQHVAAFWLAQLFSRGILPILRDAVAREVHLQAEHLGYKTDDFLVVADTPGGQRRLIGQVKSSFTVSASDNECRKAFQDFWADYKNPTLFRLDEDAFVLVTQRGTNTLLESFTALLDAARAASSGNDFSRRLGVAGFLNRKAVNYCEEIRKIISDGSGIKTDVPMLWPFLKSLHVLPLDLNTSTALTEAQTQTLLAHLASCTAFEARGMWNALLAEVSSGNAAARSYSWDLLPESLRAKVSSSGNWATKSSLDKLLAHSQLTLDGVRTSLGASFRLPRAPLVQQVMDALHANQVVLVTGPAGSGKSAISKSVVEFIAQHDPVLVFRAEEFARAHFDEVLQACQTSMSSISLGAILTGHGRKLVLVDSVERLLERTPRNAFDDLITLARKDNSWRILLTCRDYSKDLISAAFLDASQLRIAVVAIPPLDPDELTQVKAAYPEAEKPLSVERLRSILTNPYILDKALRMSWGDERPLPQSEREFRQRFWQDVVRVDHQPADGMPRKREDALMHIARDRARALTQFVRGTGCDQNALDALHRDSILVADPRVEENVAPAHDVLEDWAILRWLDREFKSPESLVQAVGTHPALRRNFRRWVGELLDRDEAAAMPLFDRAMSDKTLPSTFRDDTLISLLQSAKCAEVLTRHEVALRADGGKLLRRMVHFVQVACVETAVSSTGLKGFVPVGAGWAAVLELVRKNLNLFNSKADGFLLGLVHQWVTSVSNVIPYPPGSNAATEIAAFVVGGSDSNQIRNLALRVLVHLPLERASDATNLLGADREGTAIAEAFQYLALDGLENEAICRDLPDEVIALAKRTWLLDDQEAENLQYLSMILESAFGLVSSAHKMFPPSALRGPFLNLLKHHQSKGLDFLLSFVNRSVDWYATRLADDQFEPAHSIKLHFSDGTTREQWANWRLWGLYRATSVGPNLLQSALMALEKNLLEVADEKPKELDTVLIELLRKSNNVSITAVVASVCCAWPHLTVETVLILVENRTCVVLDRSKLVAEHDAPSRLRLPSINGAEIYEEERRKADELPHRREDLEMAALRLQISTKSGALLHDVLDRHRAALPAEKDQTNDDRVWRLSLHRMDARQYKARPALAEELPKGSSGAFAVLEIEVSETDLKEMASDATRSWTAANESAGLVMWGRKRFDRDSDIADQPNEWRTRLLQAQKLRQGVQESLFGDGAAPCLVAAVIVRDHWAEATDQERAWCIDVICEEAAVDATNWNQMTISSRNPMAANRAAARVLPLLVAKQLANEARQQRVANALALTLTHAIHEVRVYTAFGIAEGLWSLPQVALRCVNAVAHEASTLEEILTPERTLRFDQRRSYESIVSELSQVLRRDFASNGAEIPANAFANLDITTWVGANAFKRVVIIYSGALTRPEALDVAQRLCAYVLSTWTPRARGERVERDYEQEYVFEEWLVRYLLLMPEEHAALLVSPILDALEHSTENVGGLFKNLILKEDQLHTGTHFWALWSIFASRLLRSMDLAFDENYETLLSALFLSVTWKPEALSWESLRGNESRINSLFESLPPSGAALYAYSRFLKYVGSSELPVAFKRITKKLRGPTAYQVASHRSSVSILEELLLRHVYARPQELKREPELRDSVLWLLDLLVAFGSAAAFRMRDDFVTPLSE